ncbi:hypothetical protein SLEP1_g20354 [Rubroshorea leprosula]|uniref:Pectinesterase n=1 Tax=Rubroshorea leprosula TaxID=152421 RepID=A0AAV5JBK9_9ROSI|nr:hypothetical protein SLEP1_g20354 [Rubroshorea leprosula]
MPLPFSRCRLSPSQSDDSDPFAAPYPLQRSSPGTTLPPKSNTTRRLKPNFSLSRVGYLFNSDGVSLLIQASRLIGTGTFGCGTVIVEGEDFIAENVTFENSSPQGSGQAVALRATADRCAFYNCRFIGWQDTLYLHHGKQYLKDCYIRGSLDFIFGNSTALFEHCHIHCKSEGFITAQSRKSCQESTGYVFLRCVITGNGGSPYMHLGCPWVPFGRVVFAYTYVDQCIRNVGWHN